MNPSKTGHEGRGALSPDRRPRRVPGRPAAAHATSRRPACAQSNGDRHGPFGSHFDEVLQARAARRPTSSTPRSFPPSLDADAANVMRQALAGMLWSKQFYHYDVDKWLEERGSDPFKPTRKAAPRNDHWHHMYNGDVISMPDKWEYPWYAAWDLAFHVLALTLVDPDFGKQQLKLMLRERYMHPNGQIPAYEWNFGDVNPPVHAWSTIFTYRLEKAQHGRGRQGLAQELLPEAAAELHLVGQPQGPLGPQRLRGRLPGPGQHRRLRPQRAAADRRLPGTGRRHRLDGPVLPEHARDRRRAGDDRSGLRGHGPQVRRALPVDRLGDGAPGRGHGHVGRGGRLLLRRAPAARRPGPAAQGPVDGRPAAPLRGHDLRRASCWRSTPSSASGFDGSSTPGPSSAPPSTTRRSPASPAAGSASILDETKLRRVLAKMLDENEFLSPYGIRSLSRYHADHPYVIHAGGQEYRVSYLPAESDTGMFGGNSNWRGPIWMPVNALIIRALLQYYTYYGDDFTVECPTGSGRQMNLYQVAEEIARRLANIFLKDKDGRRPVYGGTEKFQEDPHWRDCLLFYEYFHGDNGAGLGASHQTGWTGVIARTMHLFATMHGWSRSSKSAGRLRSTDSGAGAGRPERGLRTSQQIQVL